jgi:trans-2-enoyl-CoA reductase
VSSDIPSILTRLNTLDKHMDEVRRKLDALVTAEAERRGREDRDERRHVEGQQDRWQVWARALIPATVLTVIFNAIIAFINLGP